MRQRGQTRSSRADQTRERILAAAVRDFSLYGLAGARTGPIARAAGVNKALLYYYFKSKQALYAAALDAVSGKIVEDAKMALQSGSSPGECLLRSVLGHFDRILTQSDFQRLFRQEMVRARRGEDKGFQALAGKLFRPLLASTKRTVQAGIRTGELRRIDWLQFVYTALGANVFYFLSAPLMQVALSFEPLAPKALATRRATAIRFLGSTLFSDPAHGARLARRVLTDVPMPTFAESPAAILQCKAAQRKIVRSAT